MTAWALFVAWVMGMAGLCWLAAIYGKLAVIADELKTQNTKGKTQ